MWEIWKVRNKHIFQNSKFNMKSFLNKVEASITEFMNSHLQKMTKVEQTFFELDGLMRKNWYHLINPPLLYKKKDLITRKECKLKAPPK